ncbi:hypothetical protein OJAV_G00235710 [Oryzias javanicus]|uniref:Ig-like domain-containing protein n=1 Tax=Oryzias javanicus TaxID=123683 RepID=A0A3S2MB30_ORYJA|nr:hypothetical protein OJAV_G00235710 [Oryzias javanicus]
MEHSLLCKLEFIFVLYSLLHSGNTQDAELTIEPKWSTFYIGESVIFKCDMKEGRTEEWTYTLKRGDWTPFSNDPQQNLLLHPLDKDHSGVYQCCGHRKSSDSTKCSNRVSIHVSDRFRSTLTAGTTTVSVGDRVTLNCSVEKSAGWKYEWFRRTSHTSESRINDGENGNIRVSRGGIYRCRGFRGEPTIYSDKSDEVTINITFSNKVSVIQKPSWSEMFRGETITLTCEVQGGEGVQWEYEWRTSQSQTFRKDWTLTASISGDYSCKSRSTHDSYSVTEWSEAVRLSVSAHTPKAELKISKSPAGGRVNLNCSVKPSSSGWSFFWFRGEKPSKPLTTQDAVFLSNGQISVSQGGVYRCRGGRGEPVYHTEFSHLVSVVDRFRSTLTAGTTTVSVGDRVTLSCSVEKSAGWKYEWFRRTSHTSESRINDGENGNIRVSQGGIYRCRGFRGEPTIYSDKSDEVIINITFSNKVSVIQKPSWSEMFRGETITLTCEVQGGEGVQWEYEWRTSQSQTFRTNRKDWTFTASISGDYSCKSRSTDDSYSATEWSEALTLSVSDLKPEAVLRVSPRWLSPGSSVTLSCEVEHESAGWSFYWYKAVPDLSHKSASYSYELLPASSNGTADNSYIIHGQTHTAGYVCRAGRGEPHVSTLYSQPDFVWSGDLHPSASLSVSPDRVTNTSPLTRSL